MTALDRAFIKAYASRRPLRGAAGDNSAVIGELQRGGTTFRIDRGHGASVAQVAAPHSKPGARKPRRPSAENEVAASQIAEGSTQSDAASETIVRKERVVISVGESLPTTDWIWQREPNPVFAHQASTADPVPAAAPNKRPVDQPSPGKLITPEVLSLGLTALSVALPAKPPFFAARATSAMPVAAPSGAATSAGAPTQSAGALAMAASVAPPIIAQPPMAPPATIEIPAAPSSIAQAADTAAVAAAPMAAAPQPGPLPSSPAAASSTSSPLSSFTLAPRVEDRLQPALEVDHFLWPAECSNLLESAQAAIERFATRLIEAARCGQRRVALIGASAGAGTTTVALCLARMAQSSGVWWGLVDGDFAHARLARQLGIADSGGWQAVAAGRERLADVSIASLDDHLVLVPLSPERIDHRELAASFRLPVMFSMLAESVDLVLIDAGTAAATDSLAGLARGARIDAAYLVYDERSTSPADVATCAGRLAASGINVAGAIANFAAD